MVRSRGVYASDLLDSGLREYIRPSSATPRFRAMTGSARRRPHDPFDLEGPFGKLGFLDAGMTRLSINPDLQYET